MVAVPVLFDTNILIDYLNGVGNADQELGRYPDRAISVITWIEVMAGTLATDQATTRAFLTTFKNLPITDEAAERSFLLRQQPKVKLPDAIIFATAQTTGRLLITRNTRDFSAANPLVRIPYRI